MFFLFFLRQPRQGKTACSAQYPSVDEEEEENEDDVLSETDGNMILEFSGGPVTNTFTV